MTEVSREYKIILVHHNNNGGVGSFSTAEAANEHLEVCKSIVSPLTKIYKQKGDSNHVQVHGPR